MKVFLRRRKRTRNRPSDQRLAYSLPWAIFVAISLTAAAPIALAVDIRNGDFEVAGDWVAMSQTVLGVAVAGPDFEAICEASLGTRGLRIGRNFASTDGSPISKVFQDFNCRPNDKDDPDRFCTVKFSAKYSMAPGEEARVSLFNAVGGLVQRGIPVSAMFEDYVLSIPGCVNPTKIYFDVIRPVPGGLFAPLASRLCVDDVSCLCTDDNRTSNDLPTPTNPLKDPPSLPSPSDPPSPGDPNVYTLPLDCNKNNMSDDVDIFNGTSSDVNSNGFPDECEAIVQDCNRNGVDDAVDIANGTSQDLNDNGRPDECERHNATCNVTGTAAGGAATATVTGFSATCMFSTPTVAGQSGATVAANLAAACNASACMQGQGITCSPNGSLFIATGFGIGPGDLTVTFTDPALSCGPSGGAPALSSLALALLATLMALVGLLVLRRM